jgi:dTDP-4-dehydrorhamnose reductase
MNYLITGKNGQLAREFISRFENDGIRFQAPEESLLDITDASAVFDAVTSWKPDVILNCAAYNLVDKAEQERDKAFAVNSAGPQNLARAAARHKAMIVHFGSDYVFDGSKENGLYKEEDPIAPLNVYGRSKGEGEDHVRRETGRFLVLRLSWVFGKGTQNFIHKLRAWATTSEYLKIACDEFSVPTSTDTVVDCTLRALEQGMTGLYHLTNSGFCSRYEWATRVFKTLGIKKFIRPVSMGAFNLPAKRPGFSAMSNASLASALNIPIPAWEDAVDSFLRSHYES